VTGIGGVGYVRVVDFLVLARDHDDFDGHSPELDEEHWAYLDDFADRLIARGPMLSDSGEHTGSLHIVRLDDHAAAVTFAHGEPYWRAGLYGSLEVARFRNLLKVTMWQRERLPGVDMSWLAVVRWPVKGEPLAADLDDTARELRADPSLVFCGLSLDEAGKGTTGLVAGFDATSPDLPEAVTRVADRIGGAQSESTVERWQRGGRNP
jgi:uncharacterized protein